MEIKIPKNFFGEDIDLTVFISEEQLHSHKTGSIYGKYFEDTGIFNIFPEELESRGEYLGEILPTGAVPDPDGFSGVLSDAGITFYWKAKEVINPKMTITQLVGPNILLLLTIRTIKWKNIKSGKRDKLTRLRISFPPFILSFRKRFKIPWTR